MTRWQHTGLAPWLLLGWLPALMAIVDGAVTAGYLILVAWVLSWLIMIRYG